MTNQYASPVPSIEAAAPQTACAVSVIIVNWNTREMTLECLRSLYAQTVTTDFEVLLVDNCQRRSDFRPVWRCKSRPLPSRRDCLQKGPRSGALL